jgi:hypothetical protein
MANRERPIARRRFVDVRQLANKRFDIDTQVRQLPAGTKTRQFIVDTSLEYVRRLAAEVPQRVVVDVQGAAGVSVTQGIGEVHSGIRRAVPAKLIVRILAARLR